MVVLPSSPDAGDTCVQTDRSEKLRHLWSPGSVTLGLSLNNRDDAQMGSRRRRVTAVWDVQLWRCIKDTQGSSRGPLLELRLSWKLGFPRTAEKQRWDQASRM